MEAVCHPSLTMIAQDIELIFAGQEADEGDIDVDGVIEVFNRLKATATKYDLPMLVGAIQSPRNNFWTRELFAELICGLGGSDYLEPLLIAAQLNLDEGHDNDGFNACIFEAFHAEPEKFCSKLKELLGRPDFKPRELVRRLLEVCEAEDAGTSQ